MGWPPNSGDRSYVSRHLSHDLFFSGDMVPLKSRERRPVSVREALTGQEDKVRDISDLSIRAE